MMRQIKNGGVMYQLIITLLSLACLPVEMLTATDSPSEAMRAGDEECGQLPDNKAHVFGMC